ncbi:MAG: di-trans,poly-cis-decaprenylcistransferase [Spirochaetia bacterium]|jgi:undecaprenyl diphosphate synthase|nr:di-trans,poly-cis-decaprenylcistransferase [Spirochaetia bacterium]
MKENRMPSHVAIIMDGNGRWARQRGLARTEGHKEGLKTAKRIVLASRKEKIEFLSLFVFSTENWKRTEQEVGFLMSLIRAHITKELDFYRKNEIRIVHSGERNGLPHDVLSEIDKAIENTSQYSSLTVNLAINYGGRDEIVRAMQRILASQENDDENPIDELKIMRYLDHPEIPDPDLIIRTGGEIRLSNFLLWQSAYSELYFSPKYWPDFTPEDLHAALIDYVHRERRFGDAR